MIFLFEGEFSGMDVFWWSLGIFFLVFARGVAIIFKPEKDSLKDLNEFMIRLREKREDEKRGT